MDIAGCAMWGVGVDTESWTRRVCHRRVESHGHRCVCHRGSQGVLWRAEGGRGRERERVMDIERCAAEG